MRLLHVITSLKQGGAQTALLNLIERMPNHSTKVIALLPDRTLAPALEAAGAIVNCIDLRRPGALVRLHMAMKRAQPDVVQTWLHHADLFAGGIARTTRLAPVVWNIRNSAFEPEGAPLLSRVVIRACARTSRWIPERIVCVAESARAAHVAAGYDASRMLVIPNGFDLTRLAPDAVTRRDVRKSLGFSDGDVVIALFARHHPMKDHSTFIAAATQIARDRPEARFLLAGDGVSWENAPLARQIRDAGIAGRTSLLERRDDVPRLLTGVDIACLSSAFGEGFPNVLGEAMATAVPVVSTDSGDSASVVGECGQIVAPRNPDALASACRRLIEAGAEARVRLGASGRERIREHFSIEAAVARYEDLYASVAAVS